MFCNLKVKFLLWCLACMNITLLWRLPYQGINDNIKGKWQELQRSVEEDSRILLTEYIQRGFMQNDEGNMDDMQYEQNLLLANVGRTEHTRNSLHNKNSHNINKGGHSKMSTIFRINDNNNPMVHSPILTLFTTMSGDVNRINIYTNTIKTWTKLKHDVNIILFTCEKDEVIAKVAKQYAWKIVELDNCVVNGTLPLLKTMFLESKRMFESDYYCYSNGDILFDTSLLDTLEYLLNIRDARLTSMFIVGQRTDIDVSVLDGTILDTADNIDLAPVVKNGHLASQNTIDYFITKGQAFPWGSIPDLAVGRRAYDNWLMWYSNKFADVTTIDITRTTTALHQLGTGGYFNSHKQNTSDYNLQFTVKFNYFDGLITCTNYKTTKDLESGNMHLVKRAFKGFCGIMAQILPKAKHDVDVIIK